MGRLQDDRRSTNSEQWSVTLEVLANRYLEFCNLMEEGVGIPKVRDRRRGGLGLPLRSASPAVRRRTGFVPRAHFYDPFSSIHAMLSKGVEPDGGTKCVL